MAKKQEPRHNNQIRSAQVRLIDIDGTQLGVKSKEEALSIAQDRGRDLVEVSPNGNPPVCRILDFKKYRYEKEKQRKEAKKHQKGGHVKEVRFRSKIGRHDFETKVNAIVRFLKHRDKVRITIPFYGREMEHRDRGHNLMREVREMSAEVGIAEAEPQMLGNRLILMLAPKS